MDDELTGAARDNSTNEVDCQLYLELGTGEHPCKTLLTGEGDGAGDGAVSIHTSETNGRADLARPEHRSAAHNVAALSRSYATQHFRLKL